MIGVVPFEPHHLETLHGCGTKRVASEFHGKALSIVDSGKTLGVAGLVSIEGVPKLSGLISDELRSRPMVLHRIVKRSLPRVMCFFDLPFIEAEVPKGDPIANRWLSALGFFFYETQNETNVYRYKKR